MVFFKTEKETNLEKTTKGFVIGYPEAEAEANKNSEVKLSEIFYDYLSILDDLNHVKFIVSGRKGCGKSAIGEYIINTQNNTPNFFSAFIRNTDLNIEKIVQIGIEEGQDIEYELLFKWIILVKLLKLIGSNNAVQDKPEIKVLNRFILKNSGFININEFETKEYIKKNGYDIEIGQLRKLVKLKLNKDIVLKGEKAPFYKLIPYLQDTIITLLNNDKENENTYILIFDDLDINFKAEDCNQINNISNLLRISKDFNNTFADHELKIKILILLRDDIVKKVELSNADTAKLISSYTTTINWWETYKNENDTKIKQFINNRIKINFNKKHIHYNTDNPWISLFNEDDFYQKTSFKYILDHTFFRPRDLILFFKPISEYNFRIPLSKNDTNTLLGVFANEFVKEIKNELNCYLTKDEIDSAFNSISKFKNKQNFEYNDLEKELHENNISNPSNIIKILFDYSIIGNIDTTTPSAIVDFKYRQKENRESCINPDLPLLIHTGINVYLNKNFRNRY